MVIVGAVPDYDVGLPLANQPGEHLAIFECRQDFAVVDVEHFGGYAEHRGGRLHLVGPPDGQRAAGHAPVTDIAIGRGDELDQVAAGGPEARHAPAANLAVVRMRAEDENPQLAALLALSRLARQSPNADQHSRATHDECPSFHVLCLPMPKVLVGRNGQALRFAGSLAKRSAETIVASACGRIQASNQTRSIPRSEGAKSCRQGTSSPRGSQTTIRWYSSFGW